MPLTPSGKPCGLGPLPTKCPKLILAILETQGSATYNELADVVPYSRKTIRLYLTAMRRNGVVECVFNGDDLRILRFRLKVLP